MVYGAPATAFGRCVLLALLAAGAPLPGASSSIPKQVPTGSFERSVLGRLAALERGEERAQDAAAAGQRALWAALERSEARVVALETAVAAMQTQDNTSGGGEEKSETHEAKEVGRLAGCACDADVQTIRGDHTALKLRTDRTESPTCSRPSAPRNGTMRCSWRPSRAAGGGGRRTGRVPGTRWLLEYRRSTRLAAAAVDTGYCRAKAAGGASGCRPNALRRARRSSSHSGTTAR
eukprot:SAG22_NODE_1497_length_4292_cov_4.207966_1_plen_235_part_00